MPIVTISVRRPKTPEFKSKIIEIIHAALVRAGVNQNDRFHRVIELGESDFHYDLTFPDVRTRRTMISCWSTSRRSSSTILSRGTNAARSARRSTSPICAPF